MLESATNLVDEIVASNLAAALIQIRGISDAKTAVQLHAEVLAALRAPPETFIPPANW